MQLRKVGIVFNPAGGSARANLVEQIADALPDVEVEIRPTTPTPGSATRLAAELAALGMDLVIGSGGDGTACQVAEGLRGTGVPMAVFPGGTGNLFARTFFAVPTPQQFAAMLLSGQPQPVDMIELSYVDDRGLTHSRLFLVGMGLGKVSDAISEASPRLKKIFGKLVYVARVARACLAPGGQSFQLSTPCGSLQTQAAAVFALNVTPPSMAMLSRGCNASDGLMDVCVMRATSFWQMVKLATCLAFGKPESSGCYTTMRTAELMLESDTPVNPNIDGDPSHLTRSIRLQAVPQAVRMILAG